MRGASPYIELPPELFELVLAKRALAARGRAKPWNAASWGQPQLARRDISAPWRTGTLLTSAAPALSLVRPFDQWDWLWRDEGGAVRVPCRTESRGGASEADGEALRPGRRRRRRLQPRICLHPQRSRVHLLRLPRRLHHISQSPARYFLWSQPYPQVTSGYLGVADGVGCPGGGPPLSDETGQARPCSLSFANSCPAGFACSTSAPTGPAVCCPANNASPLGESQLSVCPGGLPSSASLPFHSQDGLGTETMFRAVYSQTAAPLECSLGDASRCPSGYTCLPSPRYSPRFVCCIGPFAPHNGSQKWRPSWVQMEAGPVAG